MTADLQRAATLVQAAIRDAGQGLIDREALVELVALCAVAGEHLLVIGPPGTAKSEAVRRVAKSLGGTYFEYLLGRFTEPSEIFGPVDLRKLRDGLVETETAGMLPEADLAFLDEVFLGSTAILNTLLALLNERTFRRGHTQLRCPLRVCVGASNGLPEDEALAAFADRFLVRVFVEPVADARLEDLLAGGASLWRAETGAQATLAELDRLAQAAQRVELEPLRPALAHALRLLRQAGLHLTDRRAVKSQRLIAAAAALAGRTRATRADLWPLVFAVPTREGQTLARDTLREFLSESDNAALPMAALEASWGPMARARRIVEEGRTVLSAKPDSEDAMAAWRLRLESVAREIDAGFTTDGAPEEVRQLRTELAGILAA